MLTFVTGSPEDENTWKQLNGTEKQCFFNLKTGEGIY